MGKVVLFLPPPKRGRVGVGVVLIQALIPPDVPVKPGPSPSPF
jgi:hypothetical protein